MRSKIRILRKSLVLGVALSVSFLSGQEPSSVSAGSYAAARVSAVPQRAVADHKSLFQPHVTCDGDQLTITATNSTLASVLAGVRACTGAEIEVSASARGERLFAALGPGPVLEILGALLSSTDFNYLIQSSDSDPLKVRAVMVMTRSGNESATVTNDDPSSTTSPSRRAWLQSRRDTATESSSNPDQDAAQATSALEPASEISSETTDTASVQVASVEAANSNVPATSSEAVPPRPEDNPVTASSTSTPDESNVTQQRIHDMRHMFEERRQLQVQQRQPSTPQ